ncbi:uncharacterized protein DS421_11g333440 [Arachis hypogaea]|nr:uncharacterized protein DS421_11g333440 [Arachis hypogaea]
MFAFAPPPSGRQFLEDQQGWWQRQRLALARNCDSFGVQRWSRVKSYWDPPLRFRRKCLNPMLSLK